MSTPHQQPPQQPPTFTSGLVRAALRDSGGVGGVAALSGWDGQSSENPLALKLRTLRDGAFMMKRQAKVGLRSRTGALDQWRLIKSVH